MLATEHMSLLENCVQLYQQVPLAQMHSPLCAAHADCAAILPQTAAHREVGLGRHRQALAVVHDAWSASIPQIGPHVLAE